MHALLQKKNEKLNNCYSAAYISGVSSRHTCNFLSSNRGQRALERALK